MGAIIQVDYEQLQDIAQRFSVAAQEVEQMTQGLQQRVSTLSSGGWQGRGSQEFLDEMEGVVFPALQRLSTALHDSYETSNQISSLFQLAEEEAAGQFQVSYIGGAMRGSAAGVLGGSDTQDYTSDSDGGMGRLFSKFQGGVSDAAGWVGDRAQEAWGWIEDHRNEVTLGTAVFAAGVATLATGGLLAPVLAGALAAGGTTLAINSASEKYTTWDGVLGNTIAGGFVGYGVGSVGSTLSALRSTTMATNWAAGTGAAASQVTGMSQVAMPLARGLTYAPHVLNAISGGSMVVSAGGLDVFIPEQYEGTVHTISNYVGAGSAVANLGLAIGGNSLIRYAWDNPRMHPPGDSLIGGGNSRLFQSHHLYPQNQFGKLPFSASVLDDTVFLPTGNHSFIPNLHTAKGGIHPFLAQTFGAGASPSLSALQSANQQFMQRTLLTGLAKPGANVSAWAGLLFAQP